MYNSKEEAFDGSRELVDRSVPSACHHGSIRLARTGGASASIPVIGRLIVEERLGLVVDITPNGGVAGIGIGTGSIGDA